MSLIALTILTTACTFTWLNIKKLGYHLITRIIISSLFISMALIFFDLTELWYNDASITYNLFLIAELGNQLNVSFSFTINFFNVLLAFVMVSGSLFVVAFTYVDLWDDKEGSNFIITLGFFILFMLILIFASNLIVFFLGWEGISITSLLLVSFWGERLKALKATFKIFAINRVGDFFMLLSIITIALFFNDITFETLNLEVHTALHSYIVIDGFKIPVSEILGVLIVFSGCVKSAQFGFHMWLLEAMEAPLGASSLMHSSTLVMAGLTYIFKLHSFVMVSVYAVHLMIIFGALSACIGSILACFQYELKTILAYSTISNMGYMFVILGLNGVEEFFVVLVLHAYLKIFLFLIIGGIIMYNEGNQDIRFMGGLLKYAPFLAFVYFVASLCLSGLPYWTGYYYKSGIIKVVYTYSPDMWHGDLFVLISFFFTFLYGFRVGFYVFLGQKNGQKKIYKSNSTPIILIGVYGLMGTYLVYCCPGLRNYLSEISQNMIDLMSMGDRPYKGTPDVKFQIDNYHLITLANYFVSLIFIGLRISIQENNGKYLKTWKFCVWVYILFLYFFFKKCLKIFLKIT